MASNQPSHRSSVPPGENLEPPLSDSKRAAHEHEAMINEYNRNEKLRNIWAWCVIAFVVVSAAVLIIAVLSVAWHYLAPAQWSWLNDAQLHSVRSFLFSGAVVGAVGFVSSYLRKRL